jgi:tetraacyldisaccharide 4'-kinase
MTDLPRPTPPRSPWQQLYGAAHAARRRWYLMRSKRLPRPVVSVGNLHWGGAGKTPLVAAIAGHLRDRGLRTAILSRGYRSRGRGVRIVSTGEGPLLGPKVAGDEPVLLAGALPGVAVVVGPDRFDAGRHALERLDPAPEVFVLDDGFSHLRLFRDIDLLVFPADDPFASGRLFPGGRLREPLSAARRADAVLLSGEHTAAGSALAQALRSFGFEGPGFSAPARVDPPRLTSGEPLPGGTRVLLLAAIARPERFLEAARKFDLEVAGSLTFPDHHAYPPSSVASVEEAFESCRAAVLLTTTKDEVKLLGRIDLPLASLPVRAEPEDAFWTWLDRRLDQQIAALD